MHDLTLSFSIAIRHAALLLLCGVLLAACSGGSGQAPSTGKSFQGQAIKGILAHATIRVYDPESNTTVAHTRSDGDGMFNVVIPEQHDDIYLVELSVNDDTRMRCDHPQGCENASGDWEAFGSWIKPAHSFQLTGYINAQNGTHINLSPFSHVVVGTARELPGGVNAQNLATASAWVADTFKLAMSLNSVWPDITIPDDIARSRTTELAMAIYAAAFLELSDEYFVAGGVHLDALPLYDLVNEAAAIAQALSQQTAGNDGSRMALLSEQASTYAASLYNAPLQIISPPLSQAVNEDQAVIFRVDAQSGDGNIVYQWYKNGSPIPNATQSTFSLTAATLADTGTYYVVVSDVDEQLQSNSALLIVNEVIDPVVITAQPRSTSVTEGQTIHLDVQVSGDGPFSYQWQKGGSILPNATQANLTISNSTLGDAGSYRVTVSNAVSEVSSDYVNVVVTQSVAPISIHTQPQSQSANTGAQVSFNVGASGGGYLAYQWFKNGVPLTNANQAQLTLNDVDQTDAGAYYVVVSNSQGSQQSQVAQLDVSTNSVDIQILSHPVSMQLTSGETASLTVAASGTESLSYQWLFNGAPIVGATSPTYTLSNVSESDAGSYRVQVSAGETSVLSSGASVSVTARPTLELAWDIPAQREDGSELPLYEISGYIIEYGYAANTFNGQVLINDATTTSYTLEDLNSGTIYLRIATIDSDGRQGNFSAPISIDL